MGEFERKAMSLFHELGHIARFEPFQMPSLGAAPESKFQRAFQDNLSELIHYQKKILSLLGEGTVDQSVLHRTLGTYGFEFVPVDQQSEGRLKPFEPFCGGANLLLFRDGDYSSVLVEAKRSEYTDLYDRWLWAYGHYLSLVSRQTPISSSVTKELEKLVRKVARRVRLLLGGLGYLKVEAVVLRHWIVSPIAPRVVLPRSFSDFLLGCRLQPA